MIDTNATGRDPMTRSFSALLVAAFLGACAPQVTPESAEPREPAVEVIGFPDDPRALLHFVATKAAASHGPSPSMVVSRSVDGGAAHPRMTLLYMSDPRWCGSGGCTLFVLVPGEGGLTEIGRITLVQPPVVALDTQTNGMPDILVRVRGDYYPGEGEKFVVLPFDGRTYPSNPTTPPARLVPWNMIDGEIAIPEGDVALTFDR